MLIHDVIPDKEGGFTFKVRLRRGESLQTGEALKTAFNLYYGEPTEVEVNQRDEEK